MPQYVYGCQKNHRREVELRFSQLDEVITCHCGEIMHRIPQAFMVNWGGLPPHLETARPPEIAKYVKEAPEIVARTQDLKAKRTEYEKKQSTTSG